MLRVKLSRGVLFWLVCVSVPRVAVFGCLRSRQEGGCLDLFAMLYLGNCFTLFAILSWGAVWDPSAILFRGWMIQGV